MVDKIPRVNEKYMHFYSDAYQVEPDFSTYQNLSHSPRTRMV